MCPTVQKDSSSANRYVPHPVQIRFFCHPQLQVWPEVFLPATSWSCGAFLPLYPRVCIVCWGTLPFACSGRSPSDLWADSPVFLASFRVPMLGRLCQGYTRYTSVCPDTGCSSSADNSGDASIPRTACLRRSFPPAVLLWTTPFGFSCFCLNYRTILRRMP